MSRESYILALKKKDSLATVRTKLAGSPGFPEEDPAAVSATLSCVATQAPTSLLLFLCVSRFLGDDSIFRFVEFIKQVH